MGKPNEQLLAALRERWGHRDYHWPWLAPPVTVKILFYADFENAYSGGGFDGLKQVIATLGFGHFYWVTFEWHLANRGPDGSADADKVNKNLDQLNLNAYDQVWFFGFGGLPSILTDAEIAALKGFSDQHQGGVLVTGDHYDLGGAIASAVPRAGKMRMWPAPTAPGSDRLSTLRQGSTPGYVFEDQSDETPQPLRLRQYPLTTWQWWKRRSHPHPVMCGVDGPITVFPDHMHEGKVIVPGTLDPAEWPSVGGFQAAPEIVAWGSVEEPGLDHTGQEFGVVGTYDGHTVSVGRAVADSTWHHWFDINLIGDNGVVGGTTGFNATPAGQAALRQIESYFLNVAIWLCPPATQIAMRNRMFWGALWRDPLFMFSPDTAIVVLGDFGIDALGKAAPRCTVRQWILDLFPIAIRKELLDLLKSERPCPPHLEECVLGAALQTMLQGARKMGKTPVKVKDADVDGFMKQAFADAVERGLRAAGDLTSAAGQALQQLARLAKP